MSIEILSVCERIEDKEDGETNCGYRCVVEGLSGKKHFKVNVWAEYDGREMDLEMVSGEDITCNPDFMESLCSSEAFQKGMSEGYEKYEASL